MIHCDEVFDILTRGPFPTGAASDGIVESHLTRCAECRQLADALRPAIELFQEAVTPEESHGLPSYWGHSGDEADPWSSGDGDSHVEPIRRPRRQPAKRRASHAAATTAAAGGHGVVAMRRLTLAASWAAAVLLGVGLASWFARADKSREAAVSKAEWTKARWQLDEMPREWLRRLAAPEVCFASESRLHAIVAIPQGGGLSAAVRLACCKSCHGDQAADAKFPKELLATCVACHQF